MPRSEERRFDPRVSQPFPARLWGVDVEGRAIKEDTVLENFSAGGLYLRIVRRVQAGASVFVAARLSTGPPVGIPALRLIARGVVVRTEMQTDGTCGVAVKFSRRRVL